MKFLTFEKDGETSFGAVVEDGVVDLGKRHRGIPDLREAIRHGQLGDLALDVCGDMRTAVARAWSEADPGDTILLAPAAASFDQYDNFELRGEDFVREVERLLRG